MAVIKIEKSVRTRLKEVLDREPGEWLLDSKDIRGHFERFTILKNEHRKTTFLGFQCDAWIDVADVVPDQSKLGFYLKCSSVDDANDMARLFDDDQLTIVVSL